MKSSPIFDSNRLNSLLEAVDAAIITIDKEGVIAEINSATCKLFGYSNSELIGNNVKLLMPGPYREEHDGYLQHHHQTGENKIIGKGRRVEGLHKTGHIFPIHLSVAKFIESNQEFFTGIIHDLSDLTRAESNSLKLNRIINECINEVYTFSQENLKFTWANDAACRNLGFSSIDLRALTPLNIVKNLSEATLNRSMDVLKDEQAPFLAVNEQLQRKDGSFYDVELQLYYLDELDPPEFAAIAMDVTERNRMLQVVRQSQKMESIGNLTGGIAHDFNNILTVVLGNSELLQMEERNQNDTELLNEISEAARMGSRLTNRLLAFARRKSLSPKLINISEFIDGLADMLQRVLDKPVKLILSLDEKHANVRVDVSELENAIINMIVNAKDAMPDGGKVSIETSSLWLDKAVADSMNLSIGRYVRLAISDTGQGIDPSLIEQIFEPFVSTKIGSKHGTGLGLSMVYGFAKQSGGHVTCYSEVGYGTTFNMYIPEVVTETDAIETISESATVKATFKGLKVLVAEDDDQVRKLTIRRFEQLGCQVVAVSDGYAALNTYEQDPQFDLVFSDVVMTQGFSGFDLAQAIQKIHPSQTVLLTSGYAEDVLNQDKLEEAGLKLLRKPFEIEQLKSLLNELLT
jgi:PAS domain S-box-containing protein